MSCINKSVCKICRRENVKLFLKGDRCLTDKCSFDRRPYPPGQHGQSRLKFSEYALQLREKQKAKRFYGLSESQFRKTVEAAESSKEVTGTALLKNLESRLDSVIYTMGFSPSRRDARQTVSHGHITLNGRIVTIPSVIVKKGDVIELASPSRSSIKFQKIAETQSKKTLPSWLEVDASNFKGIVKDVPSRDEVSLAVEENMIVEYYSR